MLDSSSLGPLRKPFSLQDEEAELPLLHPHLRAHPDLAQELLRSAVGLGPELERSPFLHELRICWFNFFKPRLEES